MKNKSTETGDNRKKGFYLALSAGLGAVLVLALVISFSNLTTTSPDPQQLVYEPLEEEIVMAGADYTLPYLAQAPDQVAAPRGTDQTMDQALFRPRATPTAQPEAPDRQAPGQDTPANAVPQERPAPGAAPSTDPAEPGPASPAGTDGLNAPERTPENQPARDNESAGAAEVTTFEAFTESDRLLWPVYGDIAMIFSQDRLIYNPTLDQWRTNDDLRISAQEGTPVRAAAAGRVVEIGEDRVYGNFVRIDNGNGWETIFGQLMDGILVSEGDIVQTGQVIGGVGRPSVFSVLNGHHVSLRVLHEDNLVDPQLLLADNYQG